MLRLRGVQQLEQGLDFPGALVGAGRLERGSALAAQEAAEAGVSEEGGLGRLREGDAGDELCGAGGVDGCSALLEEGDAQDLVQQALVDGRPDGGVEGRLELGSLGHVADVFDDAQVDGRGREAQLAPVGGEAVEEDVGRRVVGLALLPDDSRDAGEQGEEVERRGLLQSDVVEIPGALDFGADRLVEVLHRHRGIYFVLLALAMMEPGRCLCYMYTYSEDHGSLYHPSDGDRRYSKRALHVR